MSELTGNTEVKMGSERSFGIVFAIVFLLIALFPLLGDGGVRLWSAGVAAVFGGLAFLAPELLAPLNTLWFKFGMLLSKIMSPIVMGILFFVTVTPTGLIMRARGKDLLRQKLDPDAETYWIEVDPEQAALTSMKKQF